MYLFICHLEQINTFINNINRVVCMYECLRLYVYVLHIVFCGDLVALDREGTKALIIKRVNIYYRLLCWSGQRE